MVFLTELAALLLASFLIWLGSADSTLGRQANELWVCKAGCRGTLHQETIFGQIHAAIHREERAALLLAMDFSWLDRLLLPDAIVEVTVVPKDALATYIHPTTPLDERKLPIPTSPNEERAKQTYHLVVSEVPDNIQVERHHHHHHHRGGGGGGARASYLDPPHPSSLIFSDELDEMLAHNPCFFPLAEPVRATHGKAGHMASIGNRRRRLRSERDSTLHTWSSNRLLILVGFPHFPMHATCILYKAITKDQFPQKCVYTPEKMSVNELSNIGYAHTVIHLTHSFFDKSMIHNKVVILPRADAFYSRPITLIDPVTNRSTVSNSGWGWADPATCPTETYLHNPWACNFLSISNCSNRHLSQHIKPEGLTGWSTPIARLQGEPAGSSPSAPPTPAPDPNRERYEGGLLITDALRAAYGDAPRMSEEAWAQSRLYSFLQRPNAYLRLLIRTSMRNIAAATVLGGGGGGGGGGVGAAPQTLSHLLTPCLAMHIRHQDLFLEEHRVKFGIDRSFDSHVNYGRNMTRPLALRKIFLATDNATIFEVAASKFPEFTWLFQKRPVPRKLKMFGMFTTMYQSVTENITSSAEADGDAIIPGVDVGGGGGGKERDASKKTTSEVQESVTATLSHILADWRAATYCSAILGAFDSGFAAQTYRTMCAMGRNTEGKCPASYDMRSSKEKP